MKYFTVKKTNKFPVICHIPHGSNAVPGKFRKDFLLSDKELDKEAKTMGDLFAGELYSRLFAYFGGLRAEVSRIVVDTERFEDDKKEPMSKKGMGVLYVKTSLGKALRRLDTKKKNGYLDEIYHPYHDKLSGLVGDCIKKFGFCLIIDCHTFPSEPRAYEADKKRNRPDFCLGTDKYHTPADLKNIFLKGIKEKGFSVKTDSPFRGTMIPLPFYKDKRVYSILLETNRRLYMDEKKFAKNKSFNELSNAIFSMVKETAGAFIKKQK